MIFTITVRLSIITDCSVRCGDSELLLTGNTDSLTWPGANHYPRGCYTSSTAKGWPLKTVEETFKGWIPAQRCFSEFGAGGRDNQRSQRTSFASTNSERGTRNLCTPTRQATLSSFLQLLSASCSFLQLVPFFPMVICFEGNDQAAHARSGEASRGTAALCFDVKTQTLADVGWFWWPEVCEIVQIQTQR